MAKRSWSQVETPLLGAEQERQQAGRAARAREAAPEGEAQQAHKADVKDNGTGHAGARALGRVCARVERREEWVVRG